MLNVCVAHAFLWELGQKSKTMDNYLGIGIWLSGEREWKNSSSSVDLQQTVNGSPGEFEQEVLWFAWPDYNKT